MQKQLRFLIVLAILALIVSACAPAAAPAGDAPAAEGGDGGTTEITLMRFFGDCSQHFRLSGGVLASLPDLLQGPRVVTPAQACRGVGGEDANIEPSRSWPRPLRCRLLQ